MRSFSMRSCSFFCSRSVLTCHSITALTTLPTLTDTVRWNSLNSLPCCSTAFRYSCVQTSTESELGSTAREVPSQVLLCTDEYGVRSTAREVPSQVLLRTDEYRVRSTAREVPSQVLLRTDEYGVRSTAREVPSQVLLRTDEYRVRSTAREVPSQVLLRTDEYSQKYSWVQASTKSEVQG